MPKTKTPELTPAAQYKRFKEAAKKAGVTESEEWPHQRDVNVCRLGTAVNSGAIVTAATPRRLGPATRGPEQPQR